MDKWETLRDTIQELHDNNKDKQDIEAVTRFLLNLMGVLYKEEQEVLTNIYREIKIKYNEFRLSKKDTEVLKFMIHLMEEIELYGNEKMTEEEQTIPFEKMIHPDNEAIEKRDAFMNRMEKEVTGVELQPDGTWTAIYTEVE